MATFRTMSGQSFTLGSSISSTQTTILLTAFKVPVTGTNITMATMGTSVAYGTIAPGTSQAELISFTGVTQNGDGTATLTGVTRGLNKQYPYTESTSFKQPHAGQSIFILSDAPQVFNEYPAKVNDETIVGKFTFPTGGSASAAVVGVTYSAPVADNEIATKKYIDDIAIGGSPDASTSVKGIGRVSVAPVSATIPIFVGDNDGRVPTQAENDALVGNNTDVAVGTGNKFVTQTGLQHNAEKYAADAGANDTYVITLSPVPTSYTNGMVVYFKANTANTGTATLNVNSLGAKTIVTGVSTTLATGDIVAGQMCQVIYDGTNFVLQSPKVLQASNGTATISSSTTVTVTTGFRPRQIQLHSYHTQPTMSDGGYDATTGTMWCGYTSFDTNGSVTTNGMSSSYALNITYGTSGPTATTVVINNITDTGFDTVYTKGTAAVVFYWTAIG